MDEIETIDRRPNFFFFLSPFIFIIERERRNEKTKIIVITLMVTFDNWHIVSMYEHENDMNAIYVD